MSKIKTSLEIALERTARVASNPQLVKAEQFRKDGKRLLATLIDSPQTNIKEALSKYSKEERVWVKEGITEVLLSLVALPARQHDLEKYHVLGVVLDALYPKFKESQYVVQQLEQHGYQYLEEKQQIIISLRQQYQEIAQSQVEKISKQTGMHVHLDPSSLPEFQTELQRHTQIHNQKYTQYFESIKDQIIATIKPT